MDRVNNGGLDSANDCLNNDDYDSDDPVCDLVDKLEKIRKNSFVQTSDNIKTAQKHQAKNYNARHKGIPFKVGEMVLKKNMRDAGRKVKMHNKYIGPYQITNVSSSGLYHLKDKYSYQLKRPIPLNHLVKYYGVGGFGKADVEVEDCESDSSEMETGVSYESDDYNNVSQSSSTPKMNRCQRTRIHEIDKNKNCETYGISQLQITIMQSNDSPFSSNESVLEVCIVNENNCSSHDYCDDVDNNNNPWGYMDIQDIPLDIKHEVPETVSDNSSIDSSFSSSSPTITCVEKGRDVIFSPLSNTEHLNAAKKFHVKLRLSDHIVSYRGIGLVFKHKPVVTVSANQMVHVYSTAFHYCCLDQMCTCR